MGKRIAGKPKRKSVKTKAANLSSERKLAKMGKKQKRGHSGTVVQYMTRTQAIRKLQITLKDFRRLCILKGIYPRDPKKKANGSKTTYYHVKDISYLANEPLLFQFRQFKTFMRKIRNSYGRGEVSEAKRKYDNLPQMNLDHIVKERYPSFIDAIRDLDDPLSMIHLFARLPAEGRIRTKFTNTCLRLCKEWQMYVINSHTLRKTFVSIKGIYYQAEIMGEKVTWIVPHQFSQDLPKDVDYKVMLTFLEFYQVLLRFVMYKLYTDMGLVYPPQINTKKEQEGGYLNALKVDTLTKEDGINSEVSTDIKPSTETVEDDKEEEEDDEEEDEDEQKTPEELEKESEDRIKNIEAQFKYMKEPEFNSTSKETNSDSTDKNNDEFVIDSTFADNEEAKALLKKEQDLKKFTNLFHGLYFFISREVSLETMEFLIRCFGGEVAWQGEGSPYTYTDSRITHVIMDRPTIPNKIENREYLQPQWVFDSINNGLLLPSARYVVGAQLPPHLSPFVDAEEEGYITEYEKELRALKNPEGSEKSPEEEETQLVAEDETFEKELEMERKGVSLNEKEKEDEENKETKKVVSKKRKAAELEEQQKESDEMKTYMMPKKVKRLYSKIEYGKNLKAKKIDDLQKKSQKNN